jgi:predicted ATPase
VGHLLEVSLKRVLKEEEAQSFPFSVPAIRTLARIELASVTFFVGENGSGKSTLLEAIASAAELRSLGGADLDADLTLAQQRALGRALRLAWRPRSREGFFMRAEDFFGYLKQQARTDARIVRERGEAFADVTVDVAATRAAAGAHHVDEEHASRYLAAYDARSHGESFLELFEARVRGRGLYLLDEPEAPLSPKRQLALLKLVMRAVANDAQFIIATHSPILLALPHARIYSFDTAPIEEVRYEDLDHVNVTRDFLVNPESFLRHLKP